MSQDKWNSKRRQIATQPSSLQPSSKRQNSVFPNQGHLRVNRKEPIKSLEVDSATSPSPNPVSSGTPGCLRITAPGPHGRMRNQALAKSLLLDLWQGHSVMSLTIPPPIQISPAAEMLAEELELRLTLSQE